MRSGSSSSPPATLAVELVEGSISVLGDRVGVIADPVPGPSPGGGIAATLRRAAGAAGLGRGQGELGEVGPTGRFGGGDALSLGGALEALGVEAGEVPGQLGGSGGAA